MAIAIFAARYSYRPPTLLCYSISTMTTPDRTGPSAAIAARERLVRLVGLSHATNHFGMLIFPAVLLLVQREFGIGYSGLGLLASAGLLCYGIGALPAGLLADRFGGERILAIWLFGGSLACLVIARAETPLEIGVGLALLGMASSLHHPAGSAIITRLQGVPGLHVGRAFGLIGVMGNTGLAVSPLLSAVIGAYWGWRAAFLLGALPGLLLCVPFWQSRRAPLATALEPVARRPRWSDLRTPLLILFAIETIMGFIFQGFTTFLPAYLAQYGGIPGLEAAQVTRGGILASAVFLFGGFGHLAAGRLMGLAAREIVFLVTTGLSAACLFGMGLSGGSLLVVCSALLALNHFSLSTMSNTFIAFHTPSHLGGTAFGITFTLAFGVGSLASSSMGLVGESFGLPAVFLVLAGLAAGASVLVAWFGVSVGAWPRRAADPALPA
jgi:MFS family permease